MHRRRFLRSSGALGVGSVLLPGATEPAGAVVSETKSVDDDAGPADDAGLADDTGATDDEGPAAYAPLGHVALDDAYEAVVDADGRTAFVATGDGFVTIDVSDPADPTVLAERSGLLADHDRGPLTRIWDLAIDGEDLLVVGPANPNRAVNAAVRFDVSDPSDPDQLRAVEVDFPIHNCALADGVGYLTGNDRQRNPLVIVDLASGTELARWSVVDANPAWREVDQSLRVVHDVSVRDGVAYVAYWDAGTRILDVSDPANPTLVGGVTPHDPAELAELSEFEVSREASALPGNHHYAATDETGTLMAVNAEAWAVEVSNGEDEELRGGPGGVELYDVSDPTAPAFLSSIAAPESPDPTGSGVWTTAHNFELRGDRLYTSWYEGGVKIHDVTDPADPVELAWWRDPVAASFWTAQVGVPGEFFVASSTDHRPANAGLYTFPDRPGEQVDPPAMEAALEPVTPTGTPTTTQTTATDQPPADDATADDTTADDATTDGEPSEDAAPGFGVGAGLAGVVGGAWALDRLTGATADRDEP